MSSAFESVSGSVYGVRSIASSIPSSPHSAPPLPSPPTSPHLHGVSPPGSPSSLGSFPSGLSTSIWSLDEANVSRRDEDITFSSQEHAESGHQLVIPSLALGPSLMPAPPPRESEVAYGEAIGNVRILILGGQRSLADNLLMRSPQVVHIHGWDHPGGDVTACLEASTILADRDRNVRLTVMPSFDIRDNESTKWAVGQVLQTLHASFQTLHRELHPARAPGPDFTAMLASHRTPLVTAVVLVVSEPITAREHDIISSIASHAPVITLPHPNRRRHHTTRPPTQPQSQTQTRAHSRSNSQGGVESQLLAPPLNRHATQRPHGHDRGRTTLKRSQVSHASPPFAPAPYTSASPPFAPYHSASPPFAPTYPPFSGIASPAFPPRQYVFHLNTISELSHVLFRDPRMLAGLRDAAAARFVAWREREHNPALSPIESRPTADEERKPVAGLFGFEDPEAGSDFDLGPGSEPSEAGEEDEDLIMGTMWKLRGYEHSQEPSLDVGGTLRPTPGREPLPSFNTTPDSAPRPTPPVRRRVKEFGASTIRGDRKEALERSVYHDPLHVPSLVALAVSVLPQMLGRVFGFSTRTNRIRASASEKGDGDDGEDKGWSGISVILSVGAACAATFCAGWVCGFWMA